MCHRSTHCIDTRQRDVYGFPFFRREFRQFRFFSVFSLGLFSGHASFRLETLIETLVPKRPQRFPFAQIHAFKVGVRFFGVFRRVRRRVIVIRVTWTRLIEYQRQRFSVLSIASFLLRWIFTVIGIVHHSSWLSLLFNVKNRFCFAFLSDWKNIDARIIMISWLRRFVCDFIGHGIVRPTVVYNAVFGFWNRRTGKVRPWKLNICCFSSFHYWSIF